MTLLALSALIFKNKIFFSTFVLPFLDLAHNSTNFCLSSSVRPYRIYKCNHRLSTEHSILAAELHVVCLWPPALRAILSHNVRHIMHYEPHRFNSGLCLWQVSGDVCVSTVPQYLRMHFNSRHFSL